jgi:hypothetical protein
VLLIDSSAADLIAELQRYETTGEPSPLSALLAMRYPLAANPAMDQ